MFAIIGSALFLVIAIMTVLVACGFPLGEYTVGGNVLSLLLINGIDKYKIFIL